MVKINWDKAYVYDIETFSNCFTVIFRLYGSTARKDYHKFVIHESQDDRSKLMDFLAANRPVLIGFNNQSFDGQVIEAIWKRKIKTAEEIYAFAQDIIDRQRVDRFDTPYSIFDFSFLQVDLFKINHYDNGARMTSLKWLEFTMRWFKMKDMPTHHSDAITKSKISQVLAYNRNDVDVTHEFCERCMTIIELREKLANKYDKDFMINLSDSSLAGYMGKMDFKQKLGRLPEPKEVTAVKVKDILFDYIKFDSPEFNEILAFYRAMVIEPDKKIKNGHKQLKLKGTVQNSVEFAGIEYEFGVGGLHACGQPAIHESDDEYVIKTADVKSYYPNLGIKNRIYPRHIGEAWCDINKEWFDTRKTYEKGTAENYAYKIMLNSSYGQTNSVYSYLYDPQYTMSITINGQLCLAMLAEKLSMIGEVIMVNTDGLEVKINRSLEDIYERICSEWEEQTQGLVLEHDEYRKMVVRDVNNYIAVTYDGSVKRKGFFTTYEDLISPPHEYHKNPSASIIPKALNDYFVKGIPVEETIEDSENIHEFLIGIKKRSNFEYLLLKSDDEGIVDIDRHDERVIRYYIASKGANIYKLFNDGRLTGVNRGQLVSMLMNVRDEDPNAYADLNRDYYIGECKELINLIENND